MIDFLSIPAILIAIIFHELAHGYIAYVLGDNTAKDLGRLTLNPIKHIDPFGLLAMILFKFGWAKPVPVNPNNFKDPNKGMFFVSLAGPFSNFVIAILATLILKIITLLSSNINEYILIIFYYMIWFNIMLGVFNLVPLPPLDGSKIVMSLFPEKFSNFMMKNERYFYIVTLLLIGSNVVSKIIGPIIKVLSESLLYFVLGGR